MLKLESITKTFEREIFKDLTILFPNKGLVLIKGRSGSGKSTLINIILGLENIEGGKIIYNNEIVTDFLTFRRNELSSIFQDYGLIDYFSIKQNLLIPFLSIKKEIKDETLISTLKKVGIDKKLNTLCSSLSGGEKQRIAIARSLLLDKNIYLCDEPTGSLDQENGELIFSILKEISKEKLVICVSHNDEFIDKYSDYVFSLDDKKWLMYRPLKEINNITNDFIEKRISFLDKIKISLASLKSKKIRSIVSVISCTLIFLLMLISLSFSSSIKTNIDDNFTSCLNYNMLEISNEYNLSNNENGFSMKKMIRPDKQVLSFKLSDYNFQLSYNFNYLFNTSKFIKNNEEIDISFIPFNKLENTKYKYLNEICNNMTYSDVFINKAASNLVNGSIDLIIQKSIKTENNNFNKAIDNIDIKLSLKIIKVIEEFELSSVPTIYYNYDLFQDYLSKITLQNASTLLGRRVTIFDRFSTLSNDNEELSSYSYLLWVKQDEVIIINDLLTNIGYDVYSTSLQNKNNILDIIYIAEDVINLFLIISLVIVFLLMGIIIYSMINDRKREISIYKVYGINKKEISKILIFDSLITCVFSTSIVILISPLVINILNGIIKKYIYLDNFIKVDSVNLILLVLIAFILSILFSKVPLYVINKQKESNLIR